MQSTLRLAWILVALIMTAGALQAQVLPLQQLTSDQYDIEPAWSPDGQKIAFTSLRRSESWNIWVMDADGSNLIQLTNGNKDETEPHWSPDGKQIAFSKTRRKNEDIWIMDTDGRNQFRLLKRKGKNTDLFWASDGRSLVYMVNKGVISMPEIWKMDTQTKNETSVATWDDLFYADGDISNLIEFSLSHTGEKIALVSMIEAQTDIVLWQGGTAQLLTTGKSYENNPAWSPDGEKLAYSSDVNGNYDIWMMDTNGQNQRQLTTSKSMDMMPAWSPDGQKIAFVSDTDEISGIWVMDISGGIPAAATVATRELAVAATPASATAPASHLRTDTLKIAIVQFQEKGALGIEDAGGIVAGWMSTSMHKTGVFILYERVLLQDVLEEQNMGLTGALDQSTTAQIGKIYGVDAIVTGIISKFGSTYSVMARLVDTKTAKVIATANINTKDLDAIAGMTDGLAIELAMER